MYLRSIQLLTIFFLISISLYGQKDYESGYVVNATEQVKEFTKVLELKEKVVY